MKKILIILIFIFLIVCINIEYIYLLKNYKNSDIFILVSLIEFDNESFFFSYIWIYDLRNYYRNCERELYYNVKILFLKIKIINNGKEYIIRIEFNLDYIYVYK